MARGLDVFRLKPSEQLTENELDAALAVRYDVFNPQQQPKVVYSSGLASARAYLDQLKRSSAVAADRAETIKKALDRKQRNDSLAAELEQAAGSAAPQDAVRLRGIAAALKNPGK